MLVSGWQQALTLVAVLIPGFVFQGVLRRRIGPSPDDRDLSIRLLRSLAWSISFLFAYLAVFGISVTEFLVDPAERFRNIDPRLFATVGLFLVFGFPYLAGYVVSAGQARRSLNEGGLWRAAKGEELTWVDALFTSKSGYSPVPTAWDYAASRIAPGSFVRVYNADGTWLGGRALEDAFFTSYPEGREIYLEKAWSLDEDGAFVREIPGTDGVWINCSDAAIVQVLAGGSGDRAKSEVAQSRSVVAGGEEIAHNGGKVEEEGDEGN